jgi:hypothetical protein
MTITRRIVLTIAVATAMLLAIPVAAAAATPTGADYGQHVRACAQTMGFSGDHNPGMHHGYADWDGMTCQM